MPVAGWVGGIHVGLQVFATSPYIAYVCGMPVLEPSEVILCHESAPVAYHLNS